MHQPVLDHPGGAVRALEAVPAGAAQGQRRIAAPIEEQQRLFAARERVAQRLDQPRAEPAAALGRLLVPSDDTPGADNMVVVLSHAFCMDRFGGRPSVEYCGTGIVPAQAMLRSCNAMMDMVSL